MKILPENENVLRAQQLVLETEATASAKNDFYRIAQGSEKLTPEEIQELENFAQEKSKRYGAEGYNTITVRKLPNGTWIGRRLTWIQDWSKPRTTLQELLEQI